MPNSREEEGDEELRMRTRMEAFDEGSDGDSGEYSGASSEDSGIGGGDVGEEEETGSDAGSADNTDEDDADEVTSEEVRRNREAEVARRRSIRADAPLFERVAAMQEDRANTASVVSRTRSDGEKNMSARQRNRLRRQKEKESAGSESNLNGTKSSKNVDSRKGIVHRANKHMPSEMSSVKPVSRFREILVDSSEKRKRSVDPRFNELNGSYSDKHFFTNYKFLDTYQEDEVSKLERAYKKVKSADTKQVLKQELIGRKQQMKDRRHKLAVQDRLAEMKRQEKTKVAAGVKKPFFLKESTKKDIALEEKYSELKKTGELKKYIEKKRLRNAQKDKRWMPDSRAALE